MIQVLLISNHRASLLGEVFVAPNGEMLVPVQQLNTVEDDNNIWNSAVFLKRQCFP